MEQGLGLKDGGSSGKRAIKIDGKKFYNMKFF